MAKLAIRWIRGNENGAHLEVLIQGRTGRIFHHTKTVPLPAGERIEVELPFVTEGPFKQQEAIDANVKIIVPAAEIGFKGM